MMINTERNGNGTAVGGTAASAHDKQLPGSLKKMALRDVQNENVGTIHKQQESLIPGKACGDTVKVCGNKRLTPECPPNSHGLPYLAYSGANENVMNARRRFELELGRGRFQNNVEKISDFSEPKNVGQLRPDKLMRDGNLTAVKTFSNSSPLIPSSFGKQSHSTPVSNISPELPHTVDSKSTTDRLRRETERFIHLQKFLKQCDEANQREYTQRLMHQSPAELSKHAVDLEKRAIQLTIEEGNEIQRMKALNILIKPSLGNNLLQPNKR